MSAQTRTDVLPYIFLIPVCGYSGEGEKYWDKQGGGGITGISSYLTF